ncbi:hypothetical protein TruAng_007818 [Truncatella angustata]|nr:hypothetical protein TruAng_007818 [Truncatella angustata]
MASTADAPEACEYILSVIAKVSLKHVLLQLDFDPEAGSEVVITVNSNSFALNCVQFWDQYQNLIAASVKPDLV